MTQQTFDYIVIGSGSAGSVMANRLSADPSVRVALIEAGPSDRGFPANLKTGLPVGNIFLLSDPRYNWMYRLTGHERTGNREITFPRGKLFGGSSAINGSVYIRGQREDYDGWAAAGNDGWDYAQVLPAFRDMENYDGPSGPFHGKGGELDVQKPKSMNPLTPAFVDAATQAGYARNDDFAGSVQDGFGRYHLNQRGGTRVSSARAFLHPVLHRQNLTVFDNSLARRIVIENGRAVAVEVLQAGRPLLLQASHEIILCGGTINSPQLLMLSGIGQEAHLREHGIPLVHALPGVGENLQDHPYVPITMENPSGESYALSPKSFARVMTSPLRYLLGRDGMLASNVAEAGGFIRTTPEADRPDIQMTFFVGLKSSALAIPRQHGYMVLVQLLRPKSSGTVRLSGPNPEDKPVIDPNFLADPADLAGLIRGLREARRIIAQPALSAMTGAETLPGPDVQTDAALEAAVRNIVSSTYHPVGTCKMGSDSDPMAVLDSRLRVRGLAGLRVADASSMPSIVSGNTSAAAMMIGGRGAQFILEDRQLANIGAARSVLV